MAVYNQHPANALMEERREHVGEHGTLGVVAVVYTEFQVALTGILRAQRHRRHHHAPQSVAFQSLAGGIHGYVVAQNRIREIWQMQIMRLGGAPWNQRHVVVERACSAVVARGEVYILVEFHITGANNRRERLS